MKIKTSELKDQALDWAVAKCLGVINNVEIHAGNLWYGRVTSGFTQLNYSTNPAQAYPIIEQELLSPEPLLDTNCALIKWHCRNWKGDGSDFYGPTPLIAAMRCYVASKLGDEVDIPEELK